MPLFSNLVRSEGDPRIIETGPSSLGASDRLARGLGWFSIGLGLTELLAPQAITRFLGMEGKESLIRAYGAREIASGMLSLSVDKQVGLVSRVAGDSLDVATLLTAMGEDNPKRQNVGMALAMVLGITFLDLAAAGATTVRHTRGRGPARDYSDRSGFPKGLTTSRGAARDFETPPDMAAAPRLVENRSSPTTH